MISLGSRGIFEVFLERGKDDSVKKIIFWFLGLHNYKWFWSLYRNDVFYYLVDGLNGENDLNPLF